MKILFVYPNKSSFISLDIEILSEKYEVIENMYNWKNKIKTPLYLLKQLIFILKNINIIDCFIISFGGYWSLFPSIIGYFFKKPVLIILHGTDCVAFEEINYGNLRKPILRNIIKISYQFATKLLPVSYSLISNINHFYDKDKIIKQGINHYFPKLKTKYTVISNAVDFNKWNILTDVIRDENRFVTVLGEGQFIRKGGDLIIETAFKCPQFNFFFVGISVPKHLNNIPDNVKFLGRMSAEELLVLFNESKYYLQLSSFEGFGVALCEAMLCGCIPVVSNVNDMPNIVKDTGYVLDKRNSDKLCDLLNSLFNENNSELGLKARLNIIENYSILKRKNAINQVINESLKV